MKPYNIHTRPEGFRITKFDSDLNVEDAYIIMPNDGRQGHTAEFQCSCPGGHRKDCKHRRMLAEFRLRGRIDSDWFLDGDTMQWQRLIASPEGSIEHDQALAALAHEPTELIVRDEAGPVPERVWTNGLLGIKRRI